MKRILLSLAVIAVVATVAVGATRSYFSDTETSTGNTFTAGTIDIAIDGSNPWIQKYSIGDLKPGETGNISFDIQNVGQNPVNVSKNLSSFENTGGELQDYPCSALGTDAKTSSEPECVAETAFGHRIDEVQSKIIYDLSVKVYADSASTTPIWWQAIYIDADGKSLTDIYGANGDQYVALGMIPVGGHMMVTQSYHFATSTENEYQGDTLSFNITIKADQMPQGDNGMTTVALENKVKGQDNIWNIVQGDEVEGTLSYKNQGPKFDFTFTGKVKTTGSYDLIYVGSTNNYPGVGSVLLGTGSFTAGNDGTLSGSIDVGGNITNGKIWLVPSSSYSGGLMVSWPDSDILFETGLINYTQN
ncbi:MAG: TasA family protein [Candidatus Paceibacterota bacterium]|jgi:predicted ribosomally synthesized peptide with SipW-like signal peptide